MSGLTYRPVDPPPMRHQAEALRFVMQRKGVAGLVMDPGTGKSRVVVDYLGMLWRKYGAQRVLVTAPLSALDTWPEQFRTWLPPDIPWRVHEPSGSLVARAQQIAMLGDTEPAGLQIVLTNHDTFASKRLVPGTKTVTTYDRVLQAFSKWEPDVLVVDESHRMKNHTAIRTRALTEIAKRAPRRLILTGTVAPRDPLDLFGQWLILNPDTFGTEWESFRHTYAKWGGYMNRQPVRWLNQTTMKTLVRGDAYVAKAEDCLDLPPVTHVTVPVHLTAREQKVYDDMEFDAVAELPSGETAVSPMALTKMLRLRQIAGGFVGLENGKTEPVGDSKLKVCVERVTDLVNAGKKVVIFAHFRAELTALSERISKIKGKVPVFTVHGGTPKARRLTDRQAFRDYDGPAVFVAQMRTMSLSVNELVCAQHAIFYSLSERRDDYDQALKRLDRQGQTAPVFIYHLIVPDTMDEVVANAHANKLSLETAVIGWARKRRQGEAA